MFADDANLFLWGNLELEKISEWFSANKLQIKKSWNEDRTRFTLFRRPQNKDNLPLRLPALLWKNNYEIKRPSSIKFLGIVVVEDLSWIDHINTVENKLSKTVCLLFKAKSFLNTKAMNSLYFSFFRSYLAYGNVDKMWWQIQKRFLANKNKQWKQSQWHFQIIKT